MHQEGQLLHRHHPEGTNQTLVVDDHSRARSAPIDPPTVLSPKDLGRGEAIQVNPIGNIQEEDNTDSLDSAASPTFAPSSSSPSANSTTGSSSTSEMRSSSQIAADSAFQAKAVKILVVVSSYWVISISMVFLNKYLLSSPELKLDAPLFITWFQCVVAVGCCYLLSEGRKRHPAFEMFPRFSLSLDICYKCLPLSAVFVGMIAFNNLCLKEIGVSFYNVGRSLTTIFNVLLSYFILGESTSVKAVCWCGVLITGFFIGVDQEGDGGELSWQGIIFGVLASLFVALNSIYVKRVLPFVENDSWRLLLYNNFNAVFLFLPLMLMSGEHYTVFSFERIGSGYFWAMMTLSGLFGIAIGIVTTLQIQHTSPLTHNISGTAKACAQTVIAVFVNDEFKTALWWLSNFLVLGASAGYTHTRGVEMRLAQAAKERERQLQAERDADLKRVLDIKSPTSQPTSINGDIDDDGGDGDGGGGEGNGRGRGLDLSGGRDREEIGVATKRVKGIDP